jgi:ribosomal protein L30E
VEAADAPQQGAGEVHVRRWAKSAVAAVVHLSARGQGAADQTFNGQVVRVLAVDGHRWVTSSVPVDVRVCHPGQADHRKGPACPIGPAREAAFIQVAVGPVSSHQLPDQVPEIGLISSHRVTSVPLPSPHCLAVETDPACQALGIAPNSRADLGAAIDRSYPIAQAAAIDRGCQIGRAEEIDRSSPIDREVVIVRSFRIDRVGATDPDCPIDRAEETCFQIVPGLATLIRPFARAEAITTGPLSATVRILAAVETTSALAAVIGRTFRIASTVAISMWGTRSTLVIVAAIS